MGGGAVFTGLVDFEMVGYAFLLCIALTIVIEEVTAHSKSLPTTPEVVVVEERSGCRTLCNVLTHPARVPVPWLQSRSQLRVSRPI